MGRVLVYFKGKLVASAEDMAGAELAVITLIDDMYGDVFPHDIRKEFYIVIPPPSKIAGFPESLAPRG